MANEDRAWRAVVSASLLATAAVAGCGWASTARAGSTARATFNIPAQPLPAALMLFGQQAGLQVSIPAPLVEGRTSSAAFGSLTPIAALNALLKGTGLVYRISGDIVTLEEAPRQPTGAIELGSVRVEAAPLSNDNGVYNGVHDPQRPTGPGKGYVATRTVAGSKTDTPILELPRSVSVVTRSQMDDQDIQDVSQALRYSPGIFAEPSGVAQSQTGANGMTLRGFQADAYLDGLADYYLGRNVVEPYFLDRITVLGGGDSALYGQSKPGGLIDMISKRPTETPLREIILGIGTRDRFQGSFDLSGPLDSDGHFLARVTGTGFSENSQTAFVREQRLALAPAFTWQPDEHTTLTVLGKYISSPSLGDINTVPASGTVLPNRNGEISPSFFSGDPSLNVAKQELGSIGYSFHHEFRGKISFNSNLRYSRQATTFDYLTPATTRSYVSDPTTLSRSVFYSHYISQSLLVDNQFSANLSTGDIRHQVLVGIDYFHYRFDRTTATFTPTRGTAPPNFDINIFNPVYGISIPAIPASAYTGIHQGLEQAGGYVQDQMTLGDLHFVIGGRNDWTSTPTRSGSITYQGSVAYQKDKAFTWHTGLSYRFAIGLAPYASYATSFVPQTGADAAGNAFAPTTGQQYEVGVKYQPNENIYLSAAAYHLTQQNVLTPDPNDPQFSVQTGEIRTRGIELQARANLSRDLKIIANYAYSDALNTRSNSTGTSKDNVVVTLLDKRPVAVPKELASLSGDYTIHSGALGGLGFGSGVRYVGSSYGDTANSFRVPSVVIFDATLRFDLAKIARSLSGAKLQINASNLFDKIYISSCSSSSACNFAERRTVYASLRYDW